MSPLWKKQITNQTRPSPKRIDSILNLARGKKSNHKNHFSKHNTISHSIEEISLRTFLRKKVRASMTVEAALVLPLFLFFFLNLSGAMQMIRLHGNLQLAMEEVGKKLTIHGYALENRDLPEGEENGLLQEIGDVAFSYTYVKRRIVDYLGEDYLEASPLTYGTEGLQFWESDIFSENDCIDIILTYSVSPVMEVVGHRPFRMSNRYYGHIWNGYQIPSALEGEEYTIVYIAENGVVYHESRDCTHLLLTIKRVTLQQALCSRNRQGGKYTECEKCVKGQAEGELYIADEGDRYHNDRQCPGLKRTVFVMRKGEADAYRACSRCAQN